MLASILPDDWKIVVVLGILVVAVILFALEVVTVDIVTLILLLALFASQILSVQDAFAGFSNQIIIILASIFVLSGALQETGILDAFGAKLLKLAAGKENRFLLLLMLVVSSLSALGTSLSRFIASLMASRRCSFPSRVFSVWPSWPLNRLRISWRSAGSLRVRNSPV